MRGNWCTICVVGCLSCHQPMLNTSTGPYTFFNHKQTPEGRDIAPIYVCSDVSARIQQIHHHNHWATAALSYCFCNIKTFKKAILIEGRFSKRQQGHLRGSSSTLWHFKQARVNPIKLAYDPQHSRPHSDQHLQPTASMTAVMVTVPTVMQYLPLFQ